MSLVLNFVHRNIKSIQNTLNFIFFFNDTHSLAFFELESKKLQFTMPVNKRFDVPLSLNSFTY